MCQTLRFVYEKSVRYNASEWMELLRFEYVRLVGASHPSFDPVDSWSTSHYLWSLHAVIACTHLASSPGFHFSEKDERLSDLI